MKNIGICTIIDNNNYGNRLQNYALQKYLNTIFECYNIITILNIPRTNNKKFLLLKEIKNLIKKYSTTSDNIERKKNFELFNENIKISKLMKINSNYTNFYAIITGSDQIWNPSYRLSDFDLLNIKKFNGLKISYSASIGINEFPIELKEKFSSGLKQFKSISVREDKAKNIIEELTGRNDVEVLVDPTMLLTDKEWDKVSVKPKQIDKLKYDKYILNYFLGDLSELRKNEINRIAKENNCKVINILDKDDPFYISGPSEFLWLEKHAFLICTDSFHSCVFATLYNKSFVVFDREQNNIGNMGSRIDTLLSKFKLENRRFNGKNITKENLEHDYTEAYKILEEERKKSNKFLRKALDIKDSDK